MLSYSSLCPAALLVLPHPLGSAGTELLPFTASAVMPWCGKNNVDNTDIPAVAEQRCTEPRLFCFSTSHTAWPARGWGTWSWGRRSWDRDLNQRDMAQHMAMCAVTAELRVVDQGRRAQRREWLGMGGQVVSVVLCITCFVSTCDIIFITIIIFLFPSFSALLTSSYLNPQALLCCFLPVLSPIPL